MTDWSDFQFDPALWSLLSQVWCDIEEMSSSIGTDTEAALAEEAGRVETPCCRFASKVTSSNQEGLEKLLQLALSEEFRKYFILSLLCLPRWFLV